MVFLVVVPSSNDENTIVMRNEERNKMPEMWNESLHIGLKDPSDESYPQHPPLELLVPVFVTDGCEDRLSCERR